MKNATQKVVLSTDPSTTSKTYQSNSQIINWCTTCEIICSNKHYVTICFPCTVSNKPCLFTKI